MKKLVISAFAASLVMGGASFAYADQSTTQNRNTASAYGVGTAQATRDGAKAGAAVAGEAKQWNQSKNKNRKHRRGDAQQQSGGAMTSPNAATTYSTGAIYTDRNTASASGSTGGSASGTGVQSTSSGLNVYGTVDRKSGYTEAEVDGGSTASSGERPQRTPRN